MWYIGDGWSIIETRNTNVILNLAKKKNICSDNTTFILLSVMGAEAALRIIRDSIAPRSPEPRGRGLVSYN